MPCPAHPFPICLLQYFKTLKIQIEYSTFQGNIFLTYGPFWYITYGAIINLLQGEPHHKINFSTISVIGKQAQQPDAIRILHIYMLI
jgi:hypothetical protein